MRRMFQFYAAGLAQATDPFEVAKVVHQAITTSTPVLRYPVSWGGPEILARRPTLSDEEWIGLGAIADDDAYYRAARRGSPWRQCRARADCAGPDRPAGNRGRERSRTAVSTPGRGGPGR